LELDTSAVVSVQDVKNGVSMSYLLHPAEVTFISANHKPVYPTH